MTEAQEVLKQQILIYKNNFEISKKNVDSAEANLKTYQEDRDGWERKIKELELALTKLGD